MANTLAFDSGAPTSSALKSRYRRILRFAGLALAQTWWFELVLPRFGLTKIAERTRIARAQKLARKFYFLALDLGGLMIKVGQFMSSRLDILPPQITQELEGLQDKVAPVPFPQIRQLIEQELGLDAATAFSYIDEDPIAAASLGQAYKAQLSPGLASDIGLEQVIIKVLRPGIEEIVEVDLRALHRIGGWLARVKLVSKRTDAPALVVEFAKTTLEEIDYRHEAANLERFVADFANDDRVSAPLIVWERSAQRVLTLSDVTAIKVSDVDALLEAGIDPNAVAAELARVTFEQFFVTGFFHADPHPGNIFVTPNPPGTSVDFALTYIDFGMMGEISDELRINLQRFIFAIASRDARGWVAACERLGVLLPSADTVILEQAISELFSRYGGVGVADLVQVDPNEIKEFAIRFSEIVRTLPFQLPNNFLFLARAVSLISGVTSSLNRDFNMWDAVDPFARTLLNRAGANTLSGFGKEALSTLNTLVRLPQRIDSMVTRAERGELVIRNPELERRVRMLDSSTRRTTSSVLFAALLLSGVLILDRNQSLAYVLLAASVVPLIHALGIGRIGK